MKTYHWTELKLRDSDGDSPSGEELRRAVKEWRDTGGIRDYYFFNPREAQYEHPDDPAWIEAHHKGDRVWDDLNQEWRNPEDVGPKPRDVDLSGLDD